MKVPFVNLINEYDDIRDSVLADFDSICRESSFILGESVRRFEQEFARYCETDHCVGVANGTEAIEIALRALGIGAGAEVILPAHTFVATAIGVLEAGATPVLVDIDPKTFLIDCDQIEAAITSRTKAICPVHLYGRAVNMELILSLSKKYNLRVVEDTAQAHGARWNGKRVGTFGDIGTFSFYPAKNLGAFGDAGALIMSDRNIAERCKAIRNYGSEVKYEHPIRGINSRLDSLQASVLSKKLTNLEHANTLRIAAAHYYDELLNDEEAIVLPELPDNSQHVYHLYVVRVRNRAAVQAELSAAGISTVIHYPLPFHLQEGYRELGYKQGDFPITEQIANEVLSLPMFPSITGEQQRYVAEHLKAAVRRTRKTDISYSETSV